MKNIIFLLIGFVILSSNNVSWAQDTDLLNKKFKKYQKPERSKLPKIRQKMSLDIQMSPFVTEYFSSSEQTVVYKTLNNSDTISLSERTTSSNLFNLTISPRYNLYQDEKKAFGIKAAAGLSFSVVSNNNGQSAVGTLTYNLTGFAAFGLGGPYNRVAQNGFLIGAGLMGIRAPIALGDGNSWGINREFYEELSNSPKSGKQSWVLPVIDLNYYTRPGFANMIFSYGLNVGYWSESLYVRVGVGACF